MISGKVLLWVTPIVDVNIIAHETIGDNRLILEILYEKAFLREA